MMFLTNLLCLGVGVVLGAISIVRLMKWLGSRGRCEFNVIGEKGQLYSFGHIDDEIIDKAIEKLNND